MFRDEEAQASYRWEQGINATWEAVQEDELGNIISVSSDRERSYRAKQQRITKSIRRGLIRYMVVALDCSSVAAANDYKPSRLETCKACIKKFIMDYFDQNPISQLSLILTRDRTAQKITDLSGNPKNHIHRLGQVMNMVGKASLQNTLALAMTTLQHIPNYGHRELLIVYSSLSTCDPGDIYLTVKEARLQKVRVSVVCLGAEIFVCRQLAELTGGSFSVATDATHLQELLAAQTVPPPEVQQQEALVTDFVYMGFPKRVFDANPAFGFDGKRIKLSTSAYLCPRCSTRSTDIPTQCCVCGLQLNSSSHIARSHHHLFPVPNYIEHEVVLREHAAPARSSTVSTARTQQQQQQGKRRLVVDADSYLAVCMDAAALQHLHEAEEQQEQQDPSGQSQVVAAPPDGHTAYRGTSSSSKHARGNGRVNGRGWGEGGSGDNGRGWGEGGSGDNGRGWGEGGSGDNGRGWGEGGSGDNGRGWGEGGSGDNGRGWGEGGSGDNGRGWGEGGSGDNGLRGVRSVALAAAGEGRCRGCGDCLLVEGRLVFRCPRCRHFFCVECDLFVHDSLHNCPGCPCTRE